MDEAQAKVLQDRAVAGWPAVNTKANAQANEESPLERLLAQQLAAAGVPPYERNARVLEGRRFELDFCFPSFKMGIEVQGMAHRIKKKFKADIEKRALLQMAGWQILEVGGDEIRNGKAVEWFLKLLAMRRGR